MGLRTPTSMQVPGNTSTRPASAFEVQTLQRLPRTSPPKFSSLEQIAKIYSWAGWPVGLYQKLVAVEDLCCDRSWLKWHALRHGLCLSGITNCDLDFHSPTAVKSVSATSRNWLAGCFGHSGGRGSNKKARLGKKLPSTHQQSINQIPS